MFRTVICIGLAATLILALVPTGAQAGGKGEKNFVFDIESANQFVGQDLQSMKDQILGRVKDLVFDLDRDLAIFALVTPVGEPYGDPVAVPFKSITYKTKPTGRQLCLETDSAFFMNAPRLAGKPGEMIDLTFCRKAYMHFGMVCPADKGVGMMGKERVERMEKMGEMGNMMNIRPVSLMSIIGRETRNAHNEDLGQVENLKVDMHEGRIVYGVLSVPNHVEEGLRLVIVPWRAFTYRSDREDVTVHLDKSMLMNVAFTEMEMPDLTEYDYVKKLHTHFNISPYWVEYGYVVDANEQPCSWVSGSEFNKKFNCRDQQTIEGTIVSVGCFTPEDSRTPGLRLRVQKNGGRSVIVYGGPVSMLEKKEISFSTGEMVMITGCMTEIDGRNVLMAREIRNGTKVLKLRDQSGEPMWTAEDIEEMKEPMMPEKKQMEKEGK